MTRWYFGIKVACAIGLLGTGLVFSGCASYPSRIYNARLDYIHGDYEGAVEAIDPDDCEGGRDQLLFLLERANIKQAMGDFEGSNQDYEAAKRVIEEYEERAVLSVSDGLETTGALLVNDTTLPYKGQGFEKIILFAYKALNYLMLGDLEGARVEIRRLDEQQKLEEEDHQRAIVAAEEKAEEEGIEKEQLTDIGGNLLKAYGPSADAASRVKNLYLSAFGTYLSGLVYDMKGEFDEALVDCRKVISLAPGFGYAYVDAVSLGDDLTLKGVDLDLKERGDLVIFYGCGLAPEKREIYIPIPTGRGWLSVAFPVYETVPTSLGGAEVFIDGVEAGRSEVLSDIEAKAIRTLVDQIPVLVIRQVLRVTIKAVALQAASKSSEWGELLMSLYNLFSEQADLRSWLTLPRDIQAIRVYPPVGPHQVKIALTDHAGNILEEVINDWEFKNDETILVSIRGIGYTPFLPEGLTVSTQWRSLPRVPLSLRPRPVLKYN